MRPRLDSTPLSRYVSNKKHGSHSRFARLWLAWSNGGGITGNAGGQSFGGSASPVRYESRAPLPTKRPRVADGGGGLFGAQPTPPTDRRAVTVSADRLIVCPQTYELYISNYRYIESTMPCRLPVLQRVTFNARVTVWKCARGDGVAPA